VLASQARRHGFESRHPLHKAKANACDRLIDKTAQEWLNLN
jgi:hypothetical protein